MQSGGGMLRSGEGGGWGCACWWLGLMGGVGGCVGGRVLCVSIWGYEQRVVWLGEGEVPALGVRLARGTQLGSSARGCGLARQLSGKRARQWSTLQPQVPARRAGPSSGRRASRPWSSSGGSRRAGARSCGLGRPPVRSRRPRERTSSYGRGRSRRCGRILTPLFEYVKCLLGGGRGGGVLEVGRWCG